MMHIATVSVIACRNFFQVGRNVSFTDPIIKIIKPDRGSDVTSQNCSKTNYQAQRTEHQELKSNLCPFPTSLTGEGILRQLRCVVKHCEN